MSTEVSKTLTECAEDWLAAMQSATDEETGELLTDSFMEDAQLAFEAKAVRVARMVQVLESREAAIERDLELLTKRKTQLAKAAEWLEGYLKHCMVETGIEKIDGLLAVSLRKCPPSVEIEDEAKIPSVYKKTVITEKVDREMVKLALKSGTIVPGALLITDKKTLTIR